MRLLRRLLVAIAALCASVLILALGTAATYVYRVYCARLDEVDALMGSLPSSESRPPPGFQHAVLTLENDSFEYWVARSLIVQLNPEYAVNWQRDWHLRYFVWASLLPRHCSRPQLLSLYAHFLQFEGGRGLEYGARHYFSKVPASLSERELIELLVISRSPTSYSGSQHRERLDREIERQLARLRASSPNL